MTVSVSGGKASTVSNSGRITGTASTVSERGQAQTHTTTRDAGRSQGNYGGSGRTDSGNMTMWGTPQWSIYASGNAPAPLAREATTPVTQASQPIAAPLSAAFRMASYQPRNYISAETPQPQVAQQSPLMFGAPPPSMAPQQGAAAAPQGYAGGSSGFGGFALPQYSPLPLQYTPLPTGPWNGYIR